jgi:hypothetical protein
MEDFEIDSCNEEQQPADVLEHDPARVKALL